MTGPQRFTQDEIRQAIREGRAQQVPLEEVFANPIGDIINDVFQEWGNWVSVEIYESFDHIAAELAERLLEWNNSLPEVDRHQPGWMLKKAHDEVNARIRRSLLAKLNVEMGVDPDFEP